jgi:hypothetical protein
MTSKFSALAACAAITGSVLGGGAAVAQVNTPLTLSRAGGAVAHFFPTHKVARQLGLINSAGAPGAPPPTAALLYHGGPVMTGLLQFYVIFWQPSTLQSGAATTLSSGYKTVETSLVRNYPGHDISAINTQYYQGSSPRTYIGGNGLLAASITDTSPYPASQCDASIGPNCITDAQLQAHIASLMTAQGWTGGLNKMFLVFTSSGEGSCFDTSVNSCSTETNVPFPYFCAYHSYFNTNTVYSNEPYGNPNSCLGSGTQPNKGVGGVEADPATTAASHEITEAITDPLLNAWYDSSGSEIGDLCAYDYGTNTWDPAGRSLLANQFWGGRYFELQTEYNNHTSSCVLAGP